MTKKNNFLIYGSYGYTGNLIAELCINHGLNPVLAGRNQEKLQQQAQNLKLPYLVIDLENSQEIDKALENFIAVINCAGPFMYTYAKMATACIKTNTHYLDITGEYKVFEELMKWDAQAKAAGIMLLPGAGFDVVPSDCLAQHLKSLLPDATHLTLAIAAKQNDSSAGLGISRGTAKTALEGLAEGTMIRDKGALKRISLNGKARNFDFGGNKPLMCSTISWGDIASAWWSTRIPHIEVYMALPKKIIKMNKFLSLIKSILKWAPLKSYMEKKIEQMPEGPSLKSRQNSIAKIYGEVVNTQGHSKSALMTTPNGYELTSISVLLIINKILAGHAPAGFQTPSTAYSKELVMEIPGVTRIDL
ncbi:MAG: saccharopine dehydrogenase [Legionella sp.]|nr:MAG: saccharopine dehydrogenase [Legionella sp.]